MTKIIKRCYKEIDNYLHKENIPKKNQISFISDKYPTYRDVIGKSVYTWLDGRQVDDGAEGLWRIHDKLYDLSKFIELHPGGEDWLILTQGTDITEAFETHHLSPTFPQAYLRKYYVRDAEEKRHFRITFAENGFYKTLQRRVRDKLKTEDESALIKSKFITDTLLALTFVGAILTAYLSSYILATVTGLALTWAVLASHNFLHKRDNWRMYIFNLSLISYRECRIAHVLSHHLYTNSLHDLEISLYEPLLCWLPDPNVKNIFQRYGSWVYGPLFYLCNYVLQFIKRFVTATFSDRKIFLKSDFIAFSLPLTMFMLGNHNMLVVLKLWFTIIFVGSYIFTFIGLNSSHHHPTRAHDGDALRKNPDWGLYQLDTVMDRCDIKGSLFLVLTHFGDHILHHLFPTVDHAYLPKLDEIFLETCEEFEAEIATCSWFSHIIGQHKQLARIEARKEFQK